MEKEFKETLGNHTAHLLHKLTKSAIVNTNFGNIYREKETLLTCLPVGSRTSTTQSRCVQDLYNLMFKWILPSVACVLEAVLAEAEKSWGFLAGSTTAPLSSAPPANSGLEIQLKGVPLQTQTDERGDHKILTSVLLFLRSLLSLIYKLYFRVWLTDGSKRSVKGL